MFPEHLKTKCGALICLMAQPLLAGSELININPLNTGFGGGDWSVSIGPTWRQFGDLTLRGRSRSNDALVPNLFSPGTTNDPMIGAPDAFGERTYNDGFVRPSGFTDATGLTSYWSYQNASQTSPTTIDFHATGTRSEFVRNPSTTSVFRDQEDLSSFTPQIDFLFRPTRKILPVKHLSGFLFSLSFGSSDDSSRFSGFSGSQSSNNYLRNFRDRYLLGGLQGNVPPPGFEGTFAGPGPLIPNVPADRSFTESLASSDVALITNSVYSRVDISSLSLAIGPVFEGDLSPRVSWQVACGPTLTLYDWDTKQDESLNASVSGVSQNLANFRDRNSGTDLSVGIFARATAVYDIDDEWFVNGFLQGEVATSFEMKAGPSEYEFKPGGFSFGFGLGRKF